MTSESEHLGPHATPLDDRVKADDCDRDLLEGSSILTYAGGGLSVARPAGDGKWEHLKWTISRRMDLRTSGRRQIVFRDNDMLIFPGPTSPFRTANKKRSDNSGGAASPCLQRLPSIAPSPKGTTNEKLTPGLLTTATHGSQKGG